ncbi:MAG: tripartite tricarboxylate transporter substrate binding protein BugD, partial [Pseudomonadota bacterium]|nr:tripartite tricarboxylate transporter substrate binding protein BugD [Pseudomonadota bacterium]
MIKGLRPLAAITLLTAAGLVAAQGYPNKPVTIVVPFTAGGPTDTVARSLGQAMAKPLGQSVVVENV